MEKGLRRKGVSDVIQIDYWGTRLAAGIPFAEALDHGQASQFDASCWSAAYQGEEAGLSVSLSERDGHMGFGLVLIPGTSWRLEMPPSCGLRHRSASFLNSCFIKKARYLSWPFRYGGPC
jgi:hypothetical protein